MTTGMMKQGGFTLMGRIMILVLLSLIAYGTNSAPVIERHDLPLRHRITHRVSDTVRQVKTFLTGFVIGRFTGENEALELHQGPLDERWIDVEHPADGYIHDDQVSVDEMFGDEFPAEMVIPRGEWQKWITSNHAAGFSLTLYNDTINYQAPEHSCVSNATETAIRVTWNKQLGLNHTVKLSPMALYCRVNSRRWGGSNTIANLNEASTRGMVPEDTPENKRRFGDIVAHQNAVYFPASQLPDGWQDTAKHFRIVRAFRVRTAEQFASALLRGWPVVNGRSGHSICHLELVFRDGRYFSKYADSYGTARGDNGYLYDSESKWATNGAWCLVSVTMPDDVRFPARRKSAYWRTDHAQRPAPDRDPVPRAGRDLLAGRNDGRSADRWCLAA